MSLPKKPRGRRPNGRIRWADIPSCPGYKASSDGRILGKIGRELKQQNYSGYMYIWVTLKGRGRYTEGRKFRVNRLVCEAFNGPPPTPKHDAAHEDGDSLNNSASNLKWRTRAENVANPVTVQRMIRTWTAKAAAV